MSDIQKFGNVTVNYDNVPANVLDAVKSKINTVLNDKTTIDLLTNQTNSYTIQFGDLGTEQAGKTSGNQTPNPTTTINSRILQPDGDVGVNIVTSNDVVKPFEVTLLHEIAHVQFPDLSGDSAAGHDNPVGDYLFRTYVIGTSNRLFGEHDTDENARQKEDLQLASQDEKFRASGIDLGSITTPDQVVSVLRNNTDSIKSFLSPAAQDDQYDTPTSSDGSKDRYTESLPDGKTEVIDYDHNGLKKTETIYDENGGVVSEKSFDHSDPNPQPAPDPTPTQPAPDPTPTQPAPDPTPTQPAPDPTPTQPAPDPTPTQPAPDPIAPGEGDPGEGGDPGGGDVGGGGEESVEKYATTSLQHDQAADRKLASPEHGSSTVASPVADPSHHGTTLQAIQLTSAIASFSPAPGGDTGQSAGQTETRTTLTVDPSRTPLHQAERHVS